LAQPKVYGSSAALGTNVRICRMARAPTQGTVTVADLASWTVMSTSCSHRFPVTVARFPVTRCQICHRTVAYRPGHLSEFLTEHYRRAHPRTLAIATR
jgi:hypothetical protein